jgi:hypothetical protein
VLEATARLGGIPNARWATVPHPLQSAPHAVLRERAKSAVDQFVDIVVANPEA